MVLKKSFYGWLLLAGIVTFLIHEGAHWMAGAAFGAEMKFGMNAVTFLSPLAPWQKAITDAAGPLVTILQALIAYSLILRHKAHVAFAFLYLAAFMRVIAGFISLFMPNDEARLSAFLGLGMWTLPLLVGAILLLMFWNASKHLKLTWKDQLLCYLATSAIIGLFVGLDRIVR